MISLAITTFRDPRTADLLARHELIEERRCLMRLWRHRRIRDARIADLRLSFLPPFLRRQAL